MSKKRDCTMRTRLTFSKSLMVSVGVSKLGQTAADIRWFFSEDQWRIAYYCDVLTQQLLPVVQKISGDFFILQQDSTPVHRARDIINLLERETSVHCTRPVAPNSPGLNHYKIWGEIQQRSRSTRQKFMTWMNWSSVLSMCGMAWDKTHVFAA